MKKVLVGLLMVAMGSGAFAADLGFNVTMELLSALALSKDADLVFPDTEVVAGPTNVTVAPADATAAIFQVTAGTAAANIAVSVADTTMTDGSTTIDVVDWVFGGNLTDGGDGTNGTGTLDGSGLLTNMRIGATAQLDAADAAGSYSGTATFTVVYN